MRPLYLRQKDGFLEGAFVQLIGPLLNLLHPIEGNLEHGTKAVNFNGVIKLAVV
jgi:hypothetical protein